MRLPKENFKVKIGPFTWEVIYSQDTTHEGDCFGSTHWRTQRIFLDPTVPKQKIEQTFLHEVMHACHFTCGLVHRLDGKESKVDEEEVVRSASMILYEVMIENKHIF